jgi:hypothetical protein
MGGRDGEGGNEGGAGGSDEAMTQLRRDIQSDEGGLEGGPVHVWP